MNVTVIGSYRHKNAGPWPLRNEEYFEGFCELLGERLAESNHFLTVPCDDDEESADWFCLKGYTKKKSDPSQWAVMAPAGIKVNATPKGHIDAAREADCVVMVGGANGTYAAGMTAVYRRTLVLPVACFGGAAENILSALRLRQPNVLKSALFSGTSIQQNFGKILNALIKELDGHPRLIIVHGRSRDRDNVTNILTKNCPTLHKPVILDYMGTAAVGLANKFSSHAGLSTGAIVIATPDDIGTSVLDGKGNTLTPTQVMKFGPRARENVWIEMGWLWAALGRDRILMLLKGDTGVPSDIQDAVRVPYQDDPHEVQDRILQFVEGLRVGERFAEV